MKRNIPAFLCVLMLFFCTIMAYGQPYGYYNDALRYSKTSFGGSARFQGMAGVQCAVGGDISALANNPAGLGIYRKSELTGSIGVWSASTQTTGINNQSFNDGKGNFNFGNLGVVFSNIKDDLEQGDWRGGSFGIGFTRLNNFHSQYSYTRLTAFQTGQSNSLIDYFLAGIQSNQISPNILNQQYLYGLQRDVNLAYSMYLLDTSRGAFTSEIPYGKIKQNVDVVTTGSQNQWDFTYGGNFKDKFYFGFGLGIATLRYESQTTYKETITEVQDPSPNKQQYKGFAFDYVNTLMHTGTGYNFKAGSIYKATDWLRLGFSIQTPTYYKVSETTKVGIASYFGNIKYGFNPATGNTGFELGTIPLNTTPSSIPYEFNLTTPARIGIGSTFLFNKKGFISVDAEYIKFNNAKLSDPNGNLNLDNTEISIRYNPILNLRLGGELRQDIYRLRAGFALLGDPTKDKFTFQNYSFEDLKRENIVMSVGAGIRLPDYYVDLAIINSQSQQNYKALPILPTATVSQNVVNVVVSAGMLF